MKEEINLSQKSKSYNSVWELIKLIVGGLSPVWFSLLPFLDEECHLALQGKDGEGKKPVV